MTTPIQPPLPGDDAWLEKVLRENPPAYPDDDGFTARVAVALPPPGARAERQRNLLIIAGAFAGCALAWALGGMDFTPLLTSAGDALSKFTAELSRDEQLLPAILAGGSCLVAGITGWWALARSR